MADNAPLIIKRVKKAHHGGHHGGSWKVAYADFVTAMMAFFLLLWLLNVTTDKQKKGIAEYFSPVVGTVGDTSGGSGFFQGNTVTTDGKLANNSAPITVNVPIPTTSVTETTDEGESDKLTKADQTDDGSSNTSADSGDQSGAGAGTGSTAADVAAADEKKPDQKVDPDQAAKVMADVEEQQFNQAEHLLRQAIQDIPELKELAQNLIIDKTPEGLRIQIVDQDKYAMFPRGSSVMHENARLLMHKVAEIIKKMPQKISITGHTDSTPYANAGGYDNWDLSTDRANASRRALIEAGLAPERIANMTGRADKDPLIKDDPADPRNRRISIVLLRENRATAEATQPKAEAAPGAEPAKTEGRPEAEPPKAEAAPTTPRTPAAAAIAF
jgi:chemotaxis protein MotB